MNLRWNFSSADVSIELFQKLNKGLFLDEDLLTRYLMSSGIKFLGKHLKRYGGIILDKELLKKFFEKVLSNRNIQRDDNNFVRSIKRGLNGVDRWAKEIDLIKKLDLNKQIEELLNLYSPSLNLGKVDIYILCGIRGTGITLGKEIGIDLCDEVFEIGGKLDYQEIIKMITHELHHIVCENYLLELTNKISDVYLLRALKLVGEILSEGIATYYITDLFWTRNERLNFIWEKNEETIGIIFSDVEEILVKIFDGEVINYEEILFNDQLKGYTLGYRFCQVIDKIYGKEKLFECIVNPSQFLKNYCDAVKKGKLDLPIFESKILDKLNFVS